jgi:hypothetical protein
MLDLKALNIGGHSISMATYYSLQKLTKLENLDMGNCSHNFSMKDWLQGTRKISEIHFQRAPI